MYLTFEEYKTRGGSLDEAAFNRKETKARRLLDYWTFNRLQGGLGDNEQVVKDLMFEMVETMTDGQQVTSFSNDGVSVSFSDKTEEQEMYDLAVAWLPAELVYIGAENESTI